MSESESRIHEESSLGNQIQRLIDSQRPDLALQTITSLTPDQQRDISILSLTGWAYYDLGDRATARNYLSQILEDEQKTPSQEAQASHFLGKCDLDEQKLDLARTRFERSRDLYHELNQPGSEAFNHLYIAKVDTRESKFPHAVEEISIANELFKTSNMNKGYLSHIYKSLGEVEAAQGHLLPSVYFFTLAAANSLRIFGPTVTTNYLRRIFPSKQR